ncbi:MAG: hypothetical protein ACOC1O_00075 [bacterium]
MAITNIHDAEKEFYFFQIGTSGSFHTLLFKTIFAADYKNRASLALGFPYEVEVVRKYEEVPGYWEQIQNFGGR